MSSQDLPGTLARHLKACCMLLMHQQTSAIMASEISLGLRTPTAHGWCSLLMFDLLVYGTPQPNHLLFRLRAKHINNQITNIFFRTRRTRKQVEINARAVHVLTKNRHTRFLSCFLRGIFGVIAVDLSTVRRWCAGLRGEHAGSFTMLTYDTVFPANNVPCKTLTRSLSLYCKLFLNYIFVSLWSFTVHWSAGTKTHLHC